MKIKSDSALQYKIIDFINNRSWLFMALSTTITAIAAVMYFGLFTLEKLI